MMMGKANRIVLVASVRMNKEIKKDGEVKEDDTQRDCWQENPVVISSKSFQIPKNRGSNVQNPFQTHPLSVR